MKLIIEVDEIEYDILRTALRDYRRTYQKTGDADEAQLAEQLTEKLDASMRNAKAGAQ
jgi:hypothetical protein